MLETDAVRADAEQAAADIAAGAAVVRVVKQIDADATAVDLPRGTAPVIARAEPAETNLPGGAGVAAGSAVGGVPQEIDADAAAIRCAGRAARIDDWRAGIDRGAGADACLARLEDAAGGTTGATVELISTGVDADTIAAGES